MIFTALLLSSALHPYRHIILVSTSGTPPILRAYRIRATGHAHRYKMVLVKQRQVSGDLGGIAVMKLSASPDGRRVAVITKEKGGDSLQIFALPNLTPVRSALVNSGVAQLWSPSGHSLAYQTLNGEVGLLGVDPEFSSHQPEKAAGMMWDRRGDALFLSATEQTLFANSDPEWKRINLHNDHYSYIKTSKALKQTWLKSITIADLRYLYPGFNPGRVWSKIGFLYPFVGLRHFSKKPVVDYFYSKGGVKRIVRAEIFTDVEGAQLILSPDLIIYTQSFRLFGLKSPAEANLWIGWFSPTTSTWHQDELELPDNFDLSQFGIGLDNAP